MLIETHINLLIDFKPFTMQNNQNVSAFYDEYVSLQRKTGINDRIYGLYKRLLELGVKDTSTVLELGCGIGTLTHLLSFKIKQGKIEAIDISGASIDYAKQEIKNANIRFKTQDVTDFTAELKAFDFITLFDVLEHIPLEKHATFFQRISNVMTASSYFVINLPNPDFIEHDISQEADSLQIIDQPVPLPDLIKQLDEAGLELLFFEKYGIWNIDEYQWFVLRKKRNFIQVPIETTLTFKQRLIRRFVRLRINQWNKKWQ